MLHFADETEAALQTAEKASVLAKLPEENPWIEQIRAKVKPLNISTFR